MNKKMEILELVSKRPKEKRAGMKRDKSENPW